MTNNLLTQDDDNIPVIDEAKDYLTEFVGEGKRYTDTKALAKAKAHADAHIALLEKKLDTVTADYAKAREDNVAGAKLQDLLNKLETQSALASRELNPNSNEETKPTMSVDQIESLVSTKIQQTEQQRRETENWNKVKATLSEKLGSNYKNVLREKSEALGLTDDEVNAMARKNPGLFIKTFDLNEQKQEEQFQSPPKGINTGFAPKGREVRKWSYYRNLQKENPMAWNDKSIRIQMEKDAQALGKDFYDI